MLALRLTQSWGNQPSVEKGGTNEILLSDIINVGTLSVWRTYHTRYLVKPIKYQVTAIY